MEDLLRAGAIPPLHVEKEGNTLIGEDGILPLEQARESGTRFGEVIHAAQALAGIAHQRGGSGEGVKCLTFPGAVVPLTVQRRVAPEQERAPVGRHEPVRDFSKGAHNLSFKGLWVDVCNEQ